MSAFKTCRDCSAEKPIEEFNIKYQENLRRDSYCKPCRNKRTRKWRANNRERVNEISLKSYYKTKG